MRAHSGPRTQSELLGRDPQPYQFHAERLFIGISLNLKGPYRQKQHFAHGSPTLTRPGSRPRRARAPEPERGQTWLESPSSSRSDPSPLAPALGVQPVPYRDSATDSLRRPARALPVLPAIVGSNDKELSYDLDSFDRCSEPERGRCCGRNIFQ